MNRFILRTNNEKQVRILILNKIYKDLDMLDIFTINSNKHQHTKNILQLAKNVRYNLDFSFLLSYERFF